MTWTGLGTILAAWVFLFLYRGFVPVLHISIEPKWVEGCGEMVVARVTIQNTGRIVARMKDACVQILDYDKPKSGCLLSECVPLEWNCPSEGGTNGPSENTSPTQDSNFRTAIDRGGTERRPAHQPTDGRSSTRELLARLKKALVSTEVFETMRGWMSAEKSRPDRDLHWVPWDKMDPKARNQPRRILTTTKKVEAGESIHVDFLYHRPGSVVSHFLVQVRAELDPITRWVLDLPNDSWTATAWLVSPEVLARANVQC